ncbi:MAG TPA: flagellar assembly peptidoglycan hydrolase FlgJ [Nevskiaceae bacterium]|nr:flagellar assembly peptidoglycan hydrolase FlgJ [Nevskiaceae bacterium]
MNPAAASDVASLQGLSQLRLAAKQNDPAALKAAAKQFEAMFMQMLLKSARDAKVGDEAFSGEQSGFYQDMFDQQMAQHLAAGKGLGIADLLVRQLQAKNISASPQPAASSAPADGTAQKNFISQILPHAQKAAAALGVPAQALVAQAALETGWGQHVVRNADGSSSNNLFNVKAGSSWSGASATQATTEYVQGRAQTQNAAFRSYDSVGAAFDDYVQLLKNNPRYAQSLHLADTAQFAQSLQQAGYATDPSYAQKITALADGIGRGGSSVA